MKGIEGEEKLRHSRRSEKEKGGGRGQRGVKGRAEELESVMGEKEGEKNKSENVEGCGRHGSEGSPEDCLVLLCSLILCPPVLYITLNWSNSSTGSHVKVEFPLEKHMFLLWLLSLMNIVIRGQKIRQT